MKKLLITAVFLFILSLPAAAAGDLLSSQYGAVDIEGLQDELPQEASEYLKDSAGGGSEQADAALDQILGGAGRQAGGIMRKVLKSAAVLLSAVLLCAVASCVFEGAKSVPDYIPLAGALAVTAAAAGDIGTLMGLGGKTIADMEALSKTLLPAVAASSMASGAPAASATRYLAAMLFSDILLTLINRLLVPLTYAYVAMCAANTAVGNDALEKVAGMVKGFVTWALTGLLTLFVGYITVSGAISASVDAVTLKSAKLALSGAVPVVGSVVSDAAETVMASASIIKNTVGIAGLLGVAAICVVPFIRLGAQYLIYKVTAALCSVFADKRLSGLIDGIAGAFGIILGMTGACAVLLVISVASAMLASGGA